MINSCYTFQMQKTNYTITFGLRSAEFLWLQGIRTDMCMSAAWQHHRFSEAHTPIRRLLVLFASSSLAVRSWRGREAPLVRAIFVSGSNGWALAWLVARTSRTSKRRELLSTLCVAQKSRQDISGSNPQISSPPAASSIWRSNFWSSDCLAEECLCFGWGEPGPIIYKYERSDTQKSNIWPVDETAWVPTCRARNQCSFAIISWWPRWAIESPKVICHRACASNMKFQFGQRSFTVQGWMGIVARKRQAHPSEIAQV